MINGIDVKTFDIEKFGEAIAIKAREGVECEPLKLEWILESPALSTLIRRNVGFAPRWYSGGPPALRCESAYLREAF